MTVSAGAFWVTFLLLRSLVWRCEYLLGVGEPGSPLCPVSAACGLKELVLTVGMALLTSRPHVAMLMFI